MANNNSYNDKKNLNKSGSNASAKPSGQDKQSSTSSSNRQGSSSSSKTGSSTTSGKRETSYSNRQSKSNGQTKQTTGTNSPSSGQDKQETGTSVQSRGNNNQAIRNNTQSSGQDKKETSTNAQSSEKDNQAIRNDTQLSGQDKQKTDNAQSSGKDNQAPRNAQSSDQDKKETGANAQSSEKDNQAIRNNTQSSGQDKKERSTNAQSSEKDNQAIRYNTQLSEQDKQKTDNTQSSGKDNQAARNNTQSSEQDKKETGTYAQTSRQGNQVTDDNVKSTGQDKRETGAYAQSSINKDQQESSRNGKSSNLDKQNTSANVSLRGQDQRASSSSAPSSKGWISPNFQPIIQSQQNTITTAQSSGQAKQEYDQTRGQNKQSPDISAKMYDERLSIVKRETTSLPREHRPQSMECGSLRYPLSLSTCEERRSIQPLLAARKSEQIGESRRASVRGEAIKRYVNMSKSSRSEENENALKLYSRDQYDYGKPVNVQDTESVLSILCHKNCCQKCWKNIVILRIFSLLWGILEFFCGITTSVLFVTYSEDVEQLYYPSTWLWPSMLVAALALIVTGTMNVIAIYKRLQTLTWIYICFSTLLSLYWFVLSIIMIHIGLKSIEEDVEGLAATRAGGYYFLYGHGVFLGFTVMLGSVFHMIGSVTVCVFYNVRYMRSSVART